MRYSGAELSKTPLISLSGPLSSVSLVLGPYNCFYWGAAAPQTPCCSWGASSSPDTLAGGLQLPAHPRRFLRGSASQALRFFLETKILVLRSWYQDLGTKILVPRSLGAQVLGDGGTAISTEPNRYPVFTVRTPQASLVGEKPCSARIEGIA